MISATIIRSEALKLGFHACGLARAEAVDKPTVAFFAHWLGKGKQAGMEYMQRYADIRLDPCLLMEGAKTIVSLALNYCPTEYIPAEEYQIAWYAYGRDYHDVMKTKLRELLAVVQQFYPTLHGRICCDTAPILERYWAWRAGLGWIGKHTQLIVPHAGSYFFLGELILDEEADCYDAPMVNRCGTCTRCLDACPGQALEAPYTLCAGRCLSYLTIEHRGDFPTNMNLQLGQRIYGCDECQRVCPWNRYAMPTNVEEFTPSAALLHMRREEWRNLTLEQYRSLFKGSAVKRAKYEGLMRNIRTVASEEESR